MKKHPKNVEHEETVIPETEMETPDILGKLRGELAECRKERQEYLEGWQRAKADFVNLKRESGESAQRAHDRAEAGLLLEIIGAIDSFDMARANRTLWEKAPPEWRAGIEGIYQQLHGILKRCEVESFSPLGAPFDPNEHSALQVEPTEEKAKDNIVTGVLRPGYRLKGRLIRPAEVRIAQRA